MSRRDEPLGEPARAGGVRPDPARLRALLRSLAVAADALQGDRLAEATAALDAAALAIVALHGALDRRRAGEELAQALRLAGIRVNDARLLHDPQAARDAARIVGGLDDEPLPGCGAAP